MRAVVLENELLRVTVLVDKGTDVVEFLAKRHDMDFVWWSADGLRAPSGGFLDHYEGGWQEVMPNGGAPSRHRGADFGQHDEVAGLRWDHSVEADREDEIAVRFAVRTVRVPLRLEKVMRLRSGEAVLYIEEELTNESPVPVDAMWGHHITFGAPFARAGSRVLLPPGLETVWHPVPINPSGSRRSPSDDLSVLPPPGTPSDLCYLTGFGDVGSYEVAGSELGLRVEWDAGVLPWLWYWQEFGAWTDHPWYGRHYNIGLEPFSSRPTDGLATAVANGTALTVPPHGTLGLWLRATVIERSG
jgi:hypothetical protein